MGRSPDRLRREGGQVMVEFALILGPLLLLIAGILGFGVALNWWLDTQRIANQGARWAVVNEYPGCPRSGPSGPCSPTLEQYLACGAVSEGLKPTVSISFPGGPTQNKRGDQVKVSVAKDFTFVPIVGVGTITLRGEAVMRIEQNATRYGDASYTASSCP